MPIDRDALMLAYQDACELELRAFKPGNVSVYSACHDMDVDDFRRSAKASAGPLCQTGLPVGERIFRAIEATRTVVDCNTNLGIVLLAAPLLAAAEAAKPGQGLRPALQNVLEKLTLSDADWVYRAIRIAQPGGLGEAGEQDVRQAPEVTLLEAMALAAGRDSVARQYVNCFAEVFNLAIPRYHSVFSRRGCDEWATVAVFARLLKCIPDSHVERKFGVRFTGLVAGRMAEVDRALTEAGDWDACIGLLSEVDAEFKSWGINPGTTADLTVACLLALRLETLLQ